jgi:hypothetical protein
VNAGASHGGPRGRSGAPGPAPGCRPAAARARPGRPALAGSGRHTPQLRLAARGTRAAARGRAGRRPPASDRANRRRRARRPSARRSFRDGTFGGSRSAAVRRDSGFLARQRRRDTQDMASHPRPRAGAPSIAWARGGPELGDAKPSGGVGRAARSPEAATREPRPAIRGAPCAYDSVGRRHDIGHVGPMVVRKIAAAAADIDQVAALQVWVACASKADDLGIGNHVRRKPLPIDEQ